MSWHKACILLGNSAKTWIKVSLVNADNFWHSLIQRSLFT
jgi:hypothetical protein